MKRKVKKQEAWKPLHPFFRPSMYNIPMSFILALTWAFVYMLVNLLLFSSQAAGVYIPIIDDFKMLGTSSGILLFLLYSLLCYPLACLNSYFFQIYKNSGLKGIFTMRNMMLLFLFLIILNPLIIRLVIFEIF